MALTAIIRGDSGEINLRDKVLVDYYFGSNTSGYAKAYPHYIKLHLKVDVLALLSNKEAPLEENEKLLEDLRAWRNVKNTGQELSFYRAVTLTNTFGDEIFRKIELSHAYILNFLETNELGKRSHIIKLELLQKEDSYRYEE
jgi:hypothetical protein